MLESEKWKSKSESKFSFERVVEFDLSNRAGSVELKNKFRNFMKFF